MERKDIIIIGSGPAGVSAAITAKVRGKSLLLIGSRRLSDKAYKAHQILNYPGLPDITGADYVQALQKHLDAMEIPITETQVTAVYAMSDYFAVQTPTETLEAKTVILATGVSAGKPLSGEKELLGRGVSYCATCDAHLYKGKTVAVLGYSSDSATEAAFLAESAEKVLFFTMTKQEQIIPRTEIINERPIAVLGEKKAELLQTDKASYPVDGVFILRDSVDPGQLVPGLEIADGHAVVNLQMETNIPGCFACGDIAGKPYQYIKAAGQGNVAALSAVRYLS